MGEKFWSYDGYIDTIDVKWDNIWDEWNDNQIKEKAKKYIEKRIQEWISSQEYDKLLQDTKVFLERQDIERLNLQDELDKKVLIQEAKTILYEQLWIHEDHNKNSKTEMFLKWIVDILVIDNYDLAIQIYQTNGSVIIDGLKELMSWEWIKKIAEALWESIVDLFTWNAYQKWKSVWELWLVWTWVWATMLIGKKAVKVWIREIAKVRRHKEKLVNNSEIKSEIINTNVKVEAIVPKKQIDFDKMLESDIVKLQDKDRIEAGSFFLQRKLTPEQENAIIKAHNTWTPNENGKFSVWDLRKKYIILQNKWFLPNEIKILFDKKICWKDPEIPHNILDANKVDILDFKAAFSLDKIKGLKPMEAKKLIERFTDSIDINYLINNPTRIDWVFDIIESMNNYVVKNSDNIFKLSLRELNDFRYVFSQLRKEVDYLWKSNILSQFKDDLIPLRWQLKDAMMILNPLLSPKN